MKLSIKLTALCLAASYALKATEFVDECDPDGGDPDPVECTEGDDYFGGGPPSGMGGGVQGGGSGGLCVYGPGIDTGRVSYGGGFRTPSGMSFRIVNDGVNPPVTRYVHDGKEYRYYPSGDPEPGKAATASLGESWMHHGGQTECPPETANWSCSLGRDAAGSYAGRIELNPDAMFTTNALSIESFTVLGDGDNGVDEVSAQEGAAQWRQVAAAESFYDMSVADDGCVRMLVYRPDALKDELDPETGRYLVAEGAEPFAEYGFRRIVDASGGIAVEVSHVRDGKTMPSVSYGCLRMPDGTVALSVTDGGVKTMERILGPSSGGNRRVVRERLRQGGRIDRETDVHYDVTNGLWRIAMKVEDPDGAALTNSFEYSENSGLLVRSVSSAGLVKEFSYDSYGRKTRTVEYAAGGMLPRKTTELDYCPIGVRPHDPTGQYGAGVPDDDGTASRNTPRVETVYAGDVIVSRKLRFIAYDTMNHRIVEEVQLKEPSQDILAAWGDPSNRRRFNDYMPENSCRACSKRPALVRHPDGRIDRYSYGSGNYVSGEDGTAGLFIPESGGRYFRTVVTHYPKDAVGVSADTGEPELIPLPFRTTRETVVEIRSSKAVLLRSLDVFTGDGTYENLQWTSITRDAQGRETLTVKSDGRRTEKSYDGDKMLSSTDTDGIVTEYAYDGAGRRVRSVRRGHGMRADVATDLEYDAADKVLVRTVSAEGLSTTETNVYDLAGRSVYQRTEDGVVTEWRYEVCALKGTVETVAIHAPETSVAVTNSVLAYADGRVLEKRVNGILQTMYTYGPLETVAYSGPKGAESPRWTRTGMNGFGKTVSDTKPGFGGAGLITSNLYDSAGDIVSIRTSTASGELLSAEMYGYDSFGESSLSVMDLNLNGSIDLASDRVVSNDTAYVKMSGDWWKERRTWSAQTDGSDSMTLMHTLRTRMTGLGVGGLVSETVETDAFGGETVSRVFRDRETHTVMRMSDTPDSSVDSMLVTVCGLELTNRTATGIMTIAEYDALGRPIARVDGRGIRSMVEYDSFGRVSAMVDGDGNRTVYGYDALGRQATVTDPNGLSVVTAYDAEGRIVSVRGATYPVDYAYNVFGEKVSMTTYRNESLADGDVTQWLRDEATGLVTNKVYANGKGTAYFYTPDGKLERRLWARGVETAYGYDGAGNRTSTVYSDGTPSILCEYDRNGNLLSAITEGVATNFYGYSVQGLCTNEIQNGSTIVRNYDSLGRATGYTLRGSASPHEKHVAYSYDTVGRLSSVMSSTNIFAYTYLPGTDIVSGYGCGDFAREVRYEQLRDLIASVTNRFGNRAISSFTYGNDAAGRRISIRKGGEAMGPLAGSVDAYGYNGRNEVVSAHRTLDGSAVRGFAEGFAYDPIGNRVTATGYDETGASYVSGYAANELNQYVSRSVPGLVSARGFADSNAFVTVNGNEAFRMGEYYFGSDLFDNSVQSGFAGVETYAALNCETNDLVSAVTNVAYLASSTESFIYDDDGNLLEDARFRYFWNGENRMVCAEEKLAPPGREPYVVTCAYDHMGRNVIKDGAMFIWDDYNIIVENLGASNETHNIWGLDLSGTIQGAGGVGGLLAVEKGGSIAFPAYDANGNITEYVNGGVILSHSEYSSFGRELVHTGSDGFTHRFSTKPLCRKTGMVEFQLRRYRPWCGRWMNRDAIEEDGGLNLYGYVGNKVIQSIDLYGYDIGDDYYGNYGGANRINGRIYPPGQKNDDGTYLKSEDIGEPNGPPPIDCFDKCYMEHDKCIADANDSEKTPCNMSDQEKKNCDIALSACLIGCSLNPFSVEPENPIKTIVQGWPMGIVAIPIMPFFAHPKGWLPPKGPYPDLPNRPLPEPKPHIIRFSF